MPLRPRDIERRQKWCRPKFPDKCGLILVDPGWSYKTWIHKSFKNHLPYHTMSAEEICAMPLKDIVADDAVMFLWTTNAHKAKAFKAIDTWGFEYKSSIIWDKDKISLGYYVRNQHEELLIATRGNPRKLLIRHVHHQS
jgi:N6-adenosine-specific RNA methylase IME4